MFCPKCSHENPDDTRFCGKCGTRIGENGFRIFLKRFVSSPMFLSLCIVLSVVICLGLFASPDLSGDISSFTPEYEGMRLEPFVDLLSMVSVAFSSAPRIVLLIGLWLLYAWGKKAEVDDKISGLGVVRAYVIIGQVLSYIVYIAAIVALTFLMLGVALIDIVDPFYSSNGFEFEVGRIAVVAVCAVMLAIFVAFFVLTILYYVKLLRTLKDTKALYKTGEGKVRCSSYVVSVQYIIAIILLVMAIPEVFTTGIIGFLTTLCTGVFNLLVAIVLSTYKKEMKRQ